MLVKLLAKQIPEYREVIEETINETIPEFQEKLRSELYKSLMLDQAQCWISTRDGKFEAVVLTQVEETHSVSGKILMILRIYAPNGTSSGAVKEGLEVLDAFAKSVGCDRMGGYTDNPEWEKYLTLFDVVWQTRYYEVRL